MDCPVCKGSGVTQIPHVPGSRGGWLDTTYNWSGHECGACGGTGVRREVMQTPSQETADHQLDWVRSRLRILFEFSPCFPPKLMRAWIDALDGFDVWEPKKGLALLDEYECALTEARHRYRPVRDIFSLSPSKEFELERHSTEISDYLSYLRQLMEHAQRFLVEHPNGI